MPNPLALIPNAASQAQQQLIWGQVSTSQPAPASFTSPLYVTRPRWSTDYYWALTNWPACHGATLPAAGAECLLTIDTAGNLRCVWWDGRYAPPSLASLGLARGAATLTFTSATTAAVTIAHGLGATPVSAQATITQQVTGGQMTTYAYALGATNLTIGATFSTTLTASVPVSWLAAL